MRIIKTYEGMFDIFKKKKKAIDIDSICKKYIGDPKDYALGSNLSLYTINSDESVDVNGNVYLYKKNLTKLPLKFGKVSGYFDCSYNQLTSLEGCPNYVGGTFRCSVNDLRSLEGCPNYVGGYFECITNDVTSFESCPISLGGHFDCYNNPISRIWNLFEDYSKIELFNDYDIIRGDSNNPEIVLDRLNDFLQEIGKPVVKGVEGYKNI